MARTATRIAVCAAALAAVAIATSITSAMAAQDPGCQKKIVGVGRPHQIKTVAQLNAMAAWAQSAQALGDTYSMWHNAANASVVCETLGRGYFRCAAHGKPCLPHGG